MTFPLDTKVKDTFSLVNSFFPGVNNVNPKLQKQIKETTKDHMLENSKAGFRPRESLRKIHSLAIPCPKGWDSTQDNDTRHHGVFEAS